jgi:hypothetical protein
MRRVAPQDQLIFEAGTRRDESAARYPYQSDELAGTAWSTKARERHATLPKAAVKRLRRSKCRRRGH